MADEHRSGEQKPFLNRSGRTEPQGLSKQASYTIRCGRCGVVFPTHECGKLDHFSIFRVVCPHCAWPGRYLASELHAATTPRAKLTRPLKHLS